MRGSLAQLPGEVAARRVTRSALARFAYQEPVPDIEDAAGSAPRKRRRLVKTEETVAGPSRRVRAKREVNEKKDVKTEERHVRIKREPSLAESTTSTVKSEMDMAINSLIKRDPDAPKPTPTPTPTVTPSPRKRRLPARVIRGSSPSVLPSVEPPTDWEEMYDLVRKMRLSGPARDAAVDTMGCDRLFTADASPRDKRFHILIALMLSSQTKDTVNAVAMNRLHTELPPHEPGAPPGLNVENVLAVEPTVLNALIRQVGFHNNKTK